jgi:H+/gluconate symporter-like permease
VLAALTGSASGGMTIALDALADTYMRIAAKEGIYPALMHRAAVIRAGTLDSLPHNGGCDAARRLLMVAIVSALLALVAVIALGSAFGSF